MAGLVEVSAGMALPGGLRSELRRSAPGSRRYRPADQHPAHDRRRIGARHLHGARQPVRSRAHDGRRECVHRSGRRRAAADEPVPAPARAHAAPPDPVARRVSRRGRVRLQLRWPWVLLGDRRRRPSQGTGDRPLVTMTYPIFVLAAAVAFIVTRLPLAPLTRTLRSRLRDDYRFIGPLVTPLHLVLLLAALLIALSLAGVEIRRFVAPFYLGVTWFVYRAFSILVFEGWFATVKGIKLPGVVRRL